MIYWLINVFIILVYTHNHLAKINIRFIISYYKIYRFENILSIL